MQYNGKKQSFLNAIKCWELKTELKVIFNANYIHVTFIWYLNCEWNLQAFKWALIFLIFLIF